MATQDINLNNTTPAAPSGAQNVRWQADPPSLDPTVVRNVSAYLEIPIIPIPQSAQATASAGQNQVFFSSLPIPGSVDLYQDGVLIADSLWTLSGFNAVLIANTFATGAIVSATWQTGAVTTGDVATGSVALGSTTTAPPVIRGTTQAVIVMEDSGLTYQGALALPAGTVAGDLAIVIGTCYSNLGPDASGWTVNQQTMADAWNGLVCSKVLTSADITAGSVPILTGAGSGYFTATMTTFVGATGGIREADATQFNFTSSGSNYTSQVSTSSGVLPTDLLLLFAAVPTYAGQGGLTVNEGNSIVLTPPGTLLQSSWSDDFALSMLLQSFTPSTAGVVTTTLTENFGIAIGDENDGIYQATVAVIGSVVSADAPQLPIGSSGATGELTAPVEIDTGSPLTVGLIIQGSETLAATVEFIQSAQSFLSDTTAFASDVSEGSAIVIAFLNNIGLPAGDLISDSLGNSYSLVIGGHGGEYSAVYVALNSKAGPCTVTVAAGSGYRSMNIHEYAAVASFSAVDASAITSDTSDVSSISAGPISTTTRDLIFTSVFGLLAPGESVSISGPTLREMNTAGSLLATADQFESLAGSYSTEWVFSGPTTSSVVGAIIVALKAGSTVSQTADLAQFKAPSMSGGAVLSAVNNLGQFVLALTEGSPTTTPQHGASAFDPSSGDLYIFGDSGWTVVNSSGGGGGGGGGGSAFPFSFIQEAQYVSADLLSMTVAFPSPLQSGGATAFLLIATDGSSSFTPPTGWTVDFDVVQATYARLVLCHKASAGDANATFVSGGPTAPTVYFFELSGSRTFDRVSSGGAANATQMVMPDLTPTAGAVVFAALCYLSGGGGFALLQSHNLSPLWTPFEAGAPSYSGSRILIGYMSTQGADGTLVSGPVLSYPYLSQYSDAGNAYATFSII